MFELGRLLLDFGTALRERHNDLAVDSGDFELAVFAGRLGAIAQGFDTLAELGVINRCDGRLALPEGVFCQGPPFAIGCLGGIHNDGMNMGLRVKRSAGVMLEQRDEQVAGADDLLAASLADPRFGEGLFRPCQRSAYRIHMRREQTVIAADVRQQ